VYYSIQFQKDCIELNLPAFIFTLTPKRARIATRTCSTNTRLSVNWALAICRTSSILD